MLSAILFLIVWDSDMDARYTNDLAEGFVDWKDRIYNVKFVDGDNPSKM